MARNCEQRRGRRRGGHRTFCVAGGSSVRVMRVLLPCALLFAAAPSLRAEYVVLRSGQRLHVTSYQLLGEKYRLQLTVGAVVVPVEEVVSIEPTDVFFRRLRHRPGAAPVLEMVRRA